MSENQTPGVFRQISDVFSKDGAKSARIPSASIDAGGWILWIKGIGKKGKEEGGRRYKKDEG